MQFVTHPLAPNLLNPKSASAWTSDDLGLCKVRIIDTDLATFLPNLAQVRSLGDPNSPHNRARIFDRFHAKLRTIINRPIPGSEEATLLDLTTHLLDLLEFTQPSEKENGRSGKPGLGAVWNHNESRGTGYDRRVTKRNYDLPLFMCGRTVHAVADLCIVQPSTSPMDPTGDSIILLVKATSPTQSMTTYIPQPGSAAQNHRNLNAFYPKAHPYSLAEAQFIALAIAAFQQQNRLHRRLRLPPLERKIFPALLMVGLSPVLYKFEITADLVECVQTGQTPTRITRVYRVALGSLEGAKIGDSGTKNAMKVPGDEAKTLEVLEAFRALL